MTKNQASIQLDVYKWTLKLIGLVKLIEHTVNNSHQESGINKKCDELENLFLHCKPLLLSNTYNSIYVVCKQQTQVEKNTTKEHEGH